MSTHSLTNKQRIHLKNNYFLPREINSFDNSYINYDSATFQSMIRSRRRWADSMIAVGWRKEEIFRKLRRWHYLKKKDSVFAFLRVEYRPPFHLNIKQLQEKLTIRRQLSQVLGRAYGRISSVQTIAKQGFRGIPKPQGR